MQVSLCAHTMPIQRIVNDSDVLSWIIVVGRGFSCSFFSGFQDRFFRRFLS